jgi:hypothetical protein
MLVGVNWSGARATGYDLAPAQVRQWFVDEPAEDAELELPGRG